MATFVLVPGGWTGGWVWRKLRPLLREARHDVCTPTLTGLGERAHLARTGIDLDTHITDVVNVLEFEDLHDIVLVGWSYGGMVITGMADRVPERLAQMVYLDAVVPADGQSYYDADPNGEARHAADREAAEAAGSPGFQPVPSEYIRARVADEADLAWLLAKSVAHPLATLAQPVRLRNPAATTIPRAYVFCTEGKEEGYQTVLTAERLRRAPGWRYLEVAANHMAPITAPRELAEALLSLV